MTIARVVSAVSGLLLALLAGVGFAETGGQTAAFSWQQPQARVLPSGNLEWAPRPFVFEKGASVRYIDFEGGDDARDGSTNQSA